jgi:hypothetical protein
MIINNKINKLRIAMKKSTKPIEGDILIIRIQALEWVQGSCNLKYYLFFIIRYQNRYNNLRSISDCL